jgi:hypothetical protein
MALIIYSIMLGFLGSCLGGSLGHEIFAYMFGIVGFLSPGLYVLDEIYKDMEKKKTNV